VNRTCPRGRGHATRKNVVRHSFFHRPTTFSVQGLAPRPRAPCLFGPSAWRFPAPERSAAPLAGRLPAAALTAERGPFPGGQGPAPASWHNECSSSAAGARKPPWARLDAHASSGNRTVVRAPINV
jgi:hypothetical protein